MKTTKRESRLTTDQVLGSICGIEVFADTRILRVGFIRAIPLADFDDPDLPNAAVRIVLLQLHPGEPMTGAYEFLYDHRDSFSADKLDLFRFDHGDLVTPDARLLLTRTLSFDNQGDPTTMIAEVVRSLPTLGEGTILDVSHLHVTEALDAFTTVPFCFVREVRAYKIEDEGTEVIF